MLLDLPTSGPMDQPTRANIVSHIFYCGSSDVT